MSARDRIMGRVRTATEGQGTAGSDRAAGIAAWAEAARETPVPRQARSQGAARVNQFIAKAEAASATLARLSRIEELPRALSHELRRRNLPAAIRLGSDPAFAGLDWGTLTATQGKGRMEEPATLSRAEFGLAEIGTLAFASGPDNPVTLTFLGETHFALLREENICGGFEDFWTRWRERGLDPRTLNLVTGPSRSADIGQVLQLGAHGPVALHVFLVERGT